MLPELEPLEMDGLSTDEIEALAGVFNGFSQRTRLAILLGFHHGHSTTEIADALEISRAGLQNHFTKMKTAQLLRPTDSGHEVTPFGRYFVKLVEDRQEEILDALERIEDERKIVEEDMADEVNPEYISEAEWNRLVDRELWNRIESDIVESLFIDVPDDSEPTTRQHTEIACPHCGTKTNVTLPEDENIEEVTKSIFAGNITAGCPEGHSFSVQTR